MRRRTICILLSGAFLLTSCGGVSIPAQKTPPKRQQTVYVPAPPPSSAPPAAAPTTTVSRAETVAPPSQSAAPQASRTDAGDAAFIGASAVTVGRGDTVYALSRRHRVPVPAIIRANNLEPPYLLNVGQRIVLPRGQQHVVTSGDTLYSISQRYDTGLYELARLNGIDQPYTIRLGEPLVIPETEPVSRPAAPVSAPAKQIEPEPAPEPARKMDRPAPTEADAGQIAMIPPVKPPVPVPPPPARAGKGFIWPVQGRVVSGFGAKDGGLRNDGINIRANRGTPVVAAENGVVAYAGNEIRGFGNLLLIKHDGGYITAYAHNDLLLVKRGDQVRRGQKISTVGSTGSVAEPQLHFEVRKGRRPQDPKKYLS